MAKNVGLKHYIYILKRILVYGFLFIFILIPLTGQSEVHTDVEEVDKRVEIQWLLNNSGRIPTLQVQSMFERKVKYWLEYRIQIGPHRYHWNDGPYQFLPGQTKDIQVVIPNKAYMTRYQEDFVSSLTASVVVVDPESGIRLWRQSAENAYVVFNNKGGVNKLICKSKLGSDAPAGVYSENIRSAIMGSGISLVADDDGVPSSIVPYQILRENGVGLPFTYRDKTDSCDEEAEQ